MRLLAIIIIGMLTPTFLATNVFREEDFYLLQSTYDLSLYQSAIEEIAKVIDKARKKHIYKDTAGHQLIFDDLQRRVNALRISFQTLTSPSFSTTSYLRKTEGKEASEEKYDTQLYDINTGLDRFESFHIDLGQNAEQATEQQTGEYYYNPPENRMHRGKRAVLIRRKRAILNIVGEALSYIAGTPSPTQYEMLTKQTQKQKIAILKGEKLTETLQNKMQILSTYAQQSQADEHTMNEQLNAFEANNNKLNQFFKNSIRLFYFQARVLATIDRVEGDINALKVGLAEAYRGYLSRELTNTDELRVLTAEINSKVRKTTVVFPIERIELLYGIKSTNVHRENNKIHIFTRVPLIDVTHSAKLKHIDPVIKMEIGNRADFIITNGGSYQELAYKDLEKALFLEDFGYIISKRMTDTTPGANNNPEHFMKNNWIHESLNNHFVIMAESSFAAILDCDKEDEKRLELSRLTYIYIPDHCELRANWLRVLPNQVKGVSNIHTNETFLYRDIWESLKSEESTFAVIDANLKTSNISFSSHPFINALPSPLRAARFERKNNKLGADLSGFMTETRAEIGTLFGLVLLALGSLGALVAFCWRKRVGRTQSFEMESTGESTTARLRELKEAVKAHQDEMAEEFRRLKQSASNLMASFESSQARGERERESMARSNETLRKRLDESDESNRRLGTRVTELEEACTKLRAELTKIENILMGLEGFGGPTTMKKE